MVPHAVGEKHLFVGYRSSIDDAFYLASYACRIIHGAERVHLGIEHSPAEPVPDIVGETGADEHNPVMMLYVTAPFILVYNSPEFHRMVFVLQK